MLPKRVLIDSVHIHFSAPHIGKMAFLINTFSMSSGKVLNNYQKCQLFLISAFLVYLENRKGSCEVLSIQLFYREHVK